MPSVSTVIPVYRAEQTLLHPCKQLSAAISEITKNMGGFTFVFIGFSILIHVLANFAIQRGTAREFIFLASMIAIFSGAQLFTLGIFGESLASVRFRIHMCVSAAWTRANLGNRRDICLACA